MSADDRRPVAGVVLAAGSSTRMGRNKLLLELDGEPLVRRSVRRALDAGLEPVTVVLGFEADRVAAALDGLPCRCVVNPRHDGGINTSVGVGIGAVPETAGAAVVMLADMPHVTTAMIGEVVARYRAGGAPLVVSLYDGVHAPPTLYDRALFPEFTGARGEGCGRRVVRAHWDAAAFVAWPAGALQDIDRPEDYERVRTPRERSRAG